MGFPALWLAFFYVIDDQPQIDAQWELRQGDFAIDAAGRPSLIAEDWQSVQIPNYLPVRQEPFVSVWYRFDVQVPPDGGSWGVYVAQPRANVDLYLNNVRLSSTGPNEQPLAYFTEPLLTSFDSQLATPSGNRLYVHLTRERHNAGSNRVFLAPIEQLSGYYDAVILLSQTVPAVISTLLITMVLLLVALAIPRRAERVYGWLALTLLLWSLHSLSQLVDDIPFDHWRWFGIVYFLNAWVLTVVVVFNRFYGFRARWTEVVLWATAVPLMAGIVAPAPNPLFGSPKIT